METSAVVIRSSDTIFADMLVRELALEGISAAVSAASDDTVKNAGFVADLDSGFDGVGALLTFSGDAARSPDLIRPFEIADFVNSVREHMQRAPENDGILLSGCGTSGEKLVLTSEGANLGGREISLSATERKLLALLASRPGTPFSRESIHAAVWGDADKRDSNICDVYIRYLREKLELPDGPRRIVTVRGKGYMLRA